jgi:hypothetical protein
MTDTAAVLALLRERGAETIDHPGGTLYAHLVRVFNRLAGHGLSLRVQYAGLAHAVYGTDGFDVVLLDRTDREPFRQLVGADTEQLIYRYGGCDRSRTWADLVETKQVWSRFDDRFETLAPADLRDFVDLSIVNELDVVQQSSEIAEKYGNLFRKRFAEWKLIASPQVIRDVEITLGTEIDRRGSSRSDTLVRAVEVSLTRVDISPVSPAPRAT